MNFNSDIYIEDLHSAFHSVVNVNALMGKTVLVTGATGMIGSFVVDVLMYGNKASNLCCRVLAMGRNEEKAKKRFANHWQNDMFGFIMHDINEPLPSHIPAADYVIHAASTTHPVAYATEPIETITTNVWGTRHLLDYICRVAPHARFVLMSSVEVYGQNRGDVEKFDEQYCGYIDSNTLRAGYPESKRLSEALCQAYRAQNNINYVVARLPRTYGPTMLMSDTKALSQFIRKGIAKEDIVLKSKGEQLFSYAYVADAASALLSIMLAGLDGQAYNISSPDSDIKLKDLAQIVASISGTSLKFELPDATESAGYSTATIAVMDASRLQALGWCHNYSIRLGLRRTLECLASDVK